MHDDVRSQNLYVYSILALGNENQSVSDSGQAENLKGKKRGGGTKRGWRKGEYAAYKTQQGRQGWCMAPSVLAVIKPWFAGHIGCAV